ncbi:MAG: YfhO family protein [Lachnospiraceae bacterium]|nr:YfhO family protein [Lachnospiraceae bacterium]
MNREIIKKQSFGKKGYVINYTLLFCTTAIFVFLPFIVSHKSLVFFDTNQGGDGLVIHYNSFVYYGKYIRTIIKTFLSKGRIEIPMWDMHIGYGQDIIQTLWFYAIGDPFALLSVLFPVKYSEIGYCFTTILELYCAGLAFSCYALYMKRKRNAVLLASMVYVFSSYPLLISTLHPYFTLPMVLLPLLLLGVERLLDKPFDLYYVFMIMLSACACFYFFYMLCIFVALYAVYRFFCTGKCTVKRLLLFGGKYLGNSLLGIGASAILLFPVIHSLLSSNRVNAANFIPLIYPWKYYQTLPMQLMVGGGSYYNHQGYTALALICLAVLVVLALHKIEYRRILAVGIVLVAFVSIPYAAHVFNGFAYVTNRWIWAMDLFAAYMIAAVLPEIEQLDAYRWKQAIALELLYLAVAIIPKSNRTENFLLNAALALGLTLAIYIMKDGQRCGFERIMILATGMLVIVNAYLVFSPAEGNYIRNFGKMGTAYTSLTKDAPGQAVVKLKDDSLFRFDTAGFDDGMTKRNSNMMLGVNGTSHYYSSNGGDFNSFIRDMELNNPMEQTYRNLDRRSFLDILTGIKYYVVPQGDESQRPFGYAEQAREDKNYAVYQSDVSLPLMFVTDRLIDPQQYTNATSVKKQEMLMQGVAVESGAQTETQYVECQFNDHSIGYHFTEANGLSIDGKEIIVSDENASVILELDEAATPGEELYCHFTGLDYSEKTGAATLLQKMTGDTKTSALLTIAPDTGATEILHFMNNQNAYYCGHHNFLVNLGTADAERTKIYISFNNRGRYSFEDLQIIGQPLDYAETAKENLVDQTVSDAAFKVNEISAAVNVSGNRMLVLSFLYLPGWTAYIDDVKTDIYRCNSSFMAVPLSAGDHKVRLTYRTPGLYEGAVISLISIMLAFVLWILTGRSNKKQSQGGRK